GRAGGLPQQAAQQERLHPQGDRGPDEHGLPAVQRRRGGDARHARPLRLAAEALQPTQLRRLRPRGAAAGRPGRPGPGGPSAPAAVLRRRPVLLRRLLRQGPHLRRLRLAHRRGPRRRAPTPGAPRVSPPDLDRLRSELTDPLPHPDPAALQDQAARVVGWVLRHLATPPEQPVSRPASRPQMEALLRQPPPERGDDLARVLAEFDAKVAPYAVRTNHPRFLAFIPGAPTVLSMLGDWL